MKDWNSLSVDRYYQDLSANSEVAVGILDISRDIDNKFVSKRTFDMTYFYINRMLKMGVASYVGCHKTVKDILELAATQGKKYCMVACQGLLLYRGPSLLQKSVEYAQNNPQFFVIGHIMDKKSQHHCLTKGAYPGLHRQYLFVNLAVWQKLGSPEFDELGFFTDRPRLYRNVEFSTETINSEYTPAWVKGAEGYTKHIITADGSNWIHLAAENNITIDNLDNDMRECKVFLYPYNKPNILEKVWLDKRNDKLVDQLNYSQKAWIRKLGYQEKIEKDRVYAFNTERLSGEGVRTNGKAIDHLFSAAAGFKPLAILNANGFHNNTTVYYFDWCDVSLQYKKHLLETWDGYDLHKWLLENDLKYNFSSTYRGNYESFWKQELKEFGGSLAFQKLWSRYKNLTHQFHKIDIVSDSESLFKVINNKHGTKVLWTTNIWSSEMLQWNIEPEELETAYLKFKKQIPNDLVLYGHDYCAVDLNESVKGNYTHVRYNNG
jgi:hypothetical protein